MQILTNMLPGVGPLPHGNGTYTLHVTACTPQGVCSDLSPASILITVDNQHSVKPFGTIDLPANAEVVSGGTYVNSGWALTPQPKYIPADGLTMAVFIDGQSLGPLAYNVYRPDIAGYFPGLQNSNGAGGYKHIDMTPYGAGMHSMAWSVTDSAGIVEGIGSRVFY